MELSGNEWQAIQQGRKGTKPSKWQINASTINPFLPNPVQTLEEHEWGNK